MSTLADIDARKRNLGCIMVYLGFGYECNRGVELHHPREGAGAAQKTGEYLKIPLCPGHHTGPHGVHFRRSFYARTKMDEHDLLNETLRQLEIAR